MPTTINGSSPSITFSDGTTQTTAAGPYIGSQAQFFTASGTFTVPAGVTAVKITLNGAGGGGGGAASGGTGGTGGTTSFGTYVSQTGATGGSNGNTQVGGVRGTAGGTPGASFSIPAITNPAATSIYGAGGVGRDQACQLSGATGGANTPIVGFVTGLTPASSITVTVGAGGTIGSGGSGGSIGGGGTCLVEW
jgi:hypothetical protein